MVDPPEPHFEDVFTDICKFGVLAEALMESSVLLTLFLRCRGGLEARQMEYSKTFTMSNTHHTFGHKNGCVMILESLRARFFAYLVELWVPFLQLLRVTE